MVRYDPAWFGGVVYGSAGFDRVRKRTVEYGEVRGRVGKGMVVLGVVEIVQDWSGLVRFGFYELLRLHSIRHLEI